MIQITPQMRILAATEPIDFRKGIDGLVRICRDVLENDPFNGTIFVFRNQRATAVKLLIYDGQGFWLCHKRLSVGRFPWWPNRGEKVAETAPTATALLRACELQILLSAGDPRIIRTAPDWKRIIS